MNKVPPYEHILHHVGKTFGIDSINTSLLSKLCWNMIQTFKREEFFFYWKLKANNKPPPVDVLNKSPICTTNLITHSDHEGETSPLNKNSLRRQTKSDKTLITNSLAT